MSYSVRTIQPFDKQFKRYLKKYPSLKSELITLIGQLEEKPDIGTAIGLSKIRAESSQQHGVLIYMA